MIHSALVILMWWMLTALALVCLVATCSLTRDRVARRAGLAPWKAFEAAEHAIEADRDVHVVFPRQRRGGW